MAARPLTDEQKRQIAASTFMLTNPTVAASYKADPRVQLAGALMEQGGNSAPVASGGWGIAEGLSRLGSGIAGGLLGKKERERYSAQNERLAVAEQAALAAQLANAAEERAAAVPQPANPLASVAEALSGLPGGQPSPGNVSPSGGAPSPMTAPPGYQPVPQMAPQAPQMAPQAPQMAPASFQQVPPPNPTQAPAFGGRGAQSARPDTRAFFRQAVIPEEAVPDGRGGFKDSPLGAVGPAQVMPDTAPEAARLAGLPWDANKYRNDPEYNMQLGEAYFEQQFNTFGDIEKAVAAYNAGPGAVRRATRRAATKGGHWTDYLPVTRVNGRVVDTTKDYVNRVMSGSQSFAARASGSEGGDINVDALKEQVPALPQDEALPQAPTFGDRVRSRRLQIANAILGADDDLSATERAAILANYTTPEAFDEDTRAQLQRDENMSQRDNIGYQQNLAAAQARNTNNQEARIRASQDAAAYNRDLELERIRNQGRYGLAELRGAIDAAKPPPDYSERYLWSARGREEQAELAANIERGNRQVYNGDRLLELTDRTLTGGLTRAGLAGELRSKYSADLAEINALRSEETLAKLGGRLGAGISDADRAFILSSTPVGADSDPALIRRMAQISRATGRRASEYNTLELDVLQSRDLDRIQRFTRSWQQYQREIPLFRRGQVNPDAAITFEQWSNRKVVR